MHRLPIIVLILASVGLPFFKVNLSTTTAATLLGVSVFLFGTFVSYIVSHRQMRIEKMRDAASTERSVLSTIYYRTRHVGTKEYRQKIVDAIDTYIQATQVHWVSYYFRTQKAYENLDTIIEEMPLDKPKENSAYGTIMFALSSFDMARRQQMALIGDKISRLEWSIIISLAFVIVFSLLQINTGAVVSIIIICVFLIAIDSLFMLIYNLDNLKWKVEERVVEPYEKILDTIGKPRFYTNYMIEYDQANFRNKVENVYRYAEYPYEYPNLEGVKVFLVKKDGTTELLTETPDV